MTKKIDIKFLNDNKSFIFIKFNNRRKGDLYFYHNVMKYDINKKINNKLRTPRQISRFVYNCLKNNLISMAELQDYMDQLKGLVLFHKEDIYKGNFYEIIKTHTEQIVTDIELIIDLLLPLLEKDYNK